MSRKLSYAIRISASAVAGFVIGFLLGGLGGMDSLYPLRLTDFEEFATARGWCCRGFGSTCEEEAGGARACLKAGGELFDLRKEACDSFCAPPSS